MNSDPIQRDDVIMSYSFEITRLSLKDTRLDKERSEILLELQTLCDGAALRVQLTETNKRLNRSRKALTRRATLVGEEKLLRWFYLSLPNEAHRE